MKLDIFQDRLFELKIAAASISKKGGRRSKMAGKGQGKLKEKVKRQL
jgi:hypothetical protein